MPLEIERKFLIKENSWRAQVQNSIPIQQAYFFLNAKNSVRLRICGQQANLNIKSGTLGIVRQEFEYPIPLEDAKQMLSLCMQPIIEKNRHILTYGNHKWEIDEFLAENSGLLVAEIELQAESEEFEHPPWLGEEVSHDPAYYNVSLVKKPYKQW